MGRGENLGVKHFDLNAHAASALIKDSGLSFFL